jgi:hypothetical protein
LICLPPLVGIVHERNAVRVLEVATKSTSVTLDGKLNSEYRFGCFVVGVLMIAAGALRPTHS